MDHANGLSPVWVLSCFFKSPFAADTLLHLEHANNKNDLTYVLIFLSFLKSPLRLNALSHFVQENGFFPVSILSWVFKLAHYANAPSHFKQLNSPSPVCPFMCLQIATNCDWLPHQNFKQLNGLSPVWVLSCVFILPLSWMPHFILSI